MNKSIAGLIYTILIAVIQSPAGTEVKLPDPPADTRILKIIHGWPDTAEAQTSLINQLNAQGFGGVVCNVSFTDYLENDDKWTVFKRAVRSTHEAGMAMWLYDEKGYPSGTAGGLVLENNPELEAEGLLITQATARDERITLDVPPGEIISAAAYPETDEGISLDKAIDLADAVADRELSWTPKPGDWRVIVITRDTLYHGTHAELSLAEKLPYINLLAPAATQAFLETTHARYAAHLGDDLSSLFKATFTDEPSLMSIFLKPMPYSVLPWHESLPQLYRREYGQDLIPQLPALVSDTGHAGARVRFRFWRLIAKTTARSFFGQIRDWCRAHNIPSGGHLLMEEGLVVHVPLYGDFFRCMRKLDAPSIDCLTSIPSQVPWYIARLAGSAAALENNVLTMCETSDHSQQYRAPDDNRPRRQVTEAEIRGTVNTLILNGINTITSYYTFAGLDDEALQRLNKWVGNCCNFLRGGYPVNDIAVVYPIESVWTRFKPARYLAGASPAASRIENVYRAVIEELYQSRRGFTFIGSDVLSDATIADGRLCRNNLEWRVIVLPGVDTLPSAAWTNLKRFVENGGVVIAAGELPRNDENGFPSDTVTGLGEQIFGNGTEARIKTNHSGGGGIFIPYGAEIWTDEILDKILVNDAVAEQAPATVRVTHRRINGHERFMVINDSTQPWSGKLDLSVRGTGYQFDPATGHERPLKSGENISLELDAYDAALFEFESGVAPERLELPDSLDLNMRERSLPFAEPSILRGEFVESELTHIAPEFTSKTHAWRAKGTITRSDVDTFLFMSFKYPDGIDLTGASSLALETRTPKGQHTPSELLVVLQDADGADYLASTGRVLSAPGRERTYISLHRFNPAGWSNDPDGTLDLSQIKEIRIGWGGYYGKQDETIQFTSHQLTVIY
ncbi:MAG: hypothetical protein K9N48_04315 [Verrucomicrobia bacterium]|nr:hypothetical protein [Verrucomicrobiota bacterium]MCF7709025.1 hypothetical protein [Verrucomicrobiota bacterium]